MKPLVLCILDGCGVRKESDGNAFKNANKPTFDMLMKKYPHSILQASGPYVGLPKGQMGTSEVGHMNLGSGRIAIQPLEAISAAIEDRTLFSNEKILEVLNHVKENNSNLHIFGLLSDGGVHSHIDHLLALLDMCKENDIKNVYLDICTDGRDTYEKSALTYLDKLDNKMKELGIGEIATISGRYYGMDRDNNFDRLKLSYDAICRGEGKKYKTYQDLVNDNYDSDINDEFIVPGIINKCPIADNDGVITFNFRKDRIREMFTLLSNPDEYKKMAKEKKLDIIKYKNLKTLTMYPVTETVLSPHAFSDPDMKNILVDYLHDKGISQLRIAETEKYPHVTFFFDGGKEIEYDDMKKILIPSPKVATYDLKPEMSVYEVTDNFLKEVGNYDVTIMNLANGDMVGHTGIYDAAKEAVEHMDKCLDKIYNKVMELDGTLIIIADHGNCDVMWDKDHKPVTTHTTNPVPFIVTKENIKLKDGKLSDIAPTMLYLLGLDIPKEMTGEVLIKKNSSKKKLIFIVLSLIVLFGSIFTYSYRLVHFYNLENGKQVKEDPSLVAKILNNNEIISSGSGLYQDDNDYLFKGEVNNNYVYYSGKIWRIIKINNNKTIELITDDIISSIVWNYENNDYENSYIRNYLNKTDNNYSGIIYDTLNNPDEYLADTTFCIDKLNSDNLEMCDDAIIDKVGLINYNEYKKSLAYKGFLNISKYFWTINGSEKNVWYVYDEGGVNDKSSEGDTYHSYGVRPVITLKSGLEFISGDGTKDNPYGIDSNELKSGSYITYSGYRWRIISNNENSMKLIMDEYIKDDEVISKSFGDNSNFDLENRNNIAYYLNNDFYNSLENNDWIIDGIWYNSTYTSDTEFNYAKIFENEIVSKVGLPNITDPYVTDLITLTMTKATDELVYSTNEKGMLYANKVSDELNIRPVIYIRNDLNIVSGTGTQSDPYVVEVK